MFKLFKCHNFVVVVIANTLLNYMSRQLSELLDCQWTLTNHTIDVLYYRYLTLFSDGRPNKSTATDPQQSVIPQNNSHARGKAPDHGVAIAGESPKDTVGGWSPERAETACIGRIRASPTAWALFERRFAEGRRSARETTPQAEVRSRAGPPGRVPPRLGRFQPRSMKN